MRRHSAHVDAEALAELGEGLISGRRAARIHAHLASCKQCADVSAGLSAVSVLLAAIPSPAMPDAVARRLSGALAATAAARSGTAVASARLADGESFRHPERVRGVTSWPRWRGLTGPAAARVLAAAATVCLLTAGGYTLVRLTSHGAPTSTGPVGPHPLFPSSPQGPNRPGPTPKFTVVTSGTDYQPARLGAQIEAEFGRVHSSHGRETGRLPTAREDDCVLRVTGWTPPALVDAADYEGHTAMVIALDATGTQIGQAWVVGPACSAENSDILMHVMLPQSGGSRHAALLGG
jgi:hypothetical protein